MKETINYGLKKPDGTDTVNIDDLNSNADIVDEKLKDLYDTKATKDLVTTSANGLMSSSDKIKLNGVAAGANAYTHPSTHVATMITEDATHRFVSDTEKSTWNGKASTSIATTTANGLMSSADKTKLNGIAAGANAYVHPGNHPATMITEDAAHRFLTDEERKLIQAWENFKSSGGTIPGNITLTNTSSIIFTADKSLRSESGNITLEAKNDNAIFLRSTRKSDDRVGTIGFYNNNNELSLRPSGETNASGAIVDLGIDAVPFRDMYLGGKIINVNGYTKLPNKVIIQWGAIQVTGGVNGVEVILPVAFSTNYRLVATPVDLALGNSPITAWVTGKSNNQFWIRATTNCSIQWIAIGY
jgi:hypothetical protein